jgi:hypothetical protein
MGIQWFVHYVKKNIEKSFPKNNFKNQIGLSGPNPCSIEQTFFYISNEHIFYYEDTHS